MPAESPDFRALFESAPGLYLVLSPDLTIVAASDAYLRATMTKREEVLGRNIFEVFPDNPDDPRTTGVANLRASLMRVLTLRVPDTMAVQKYDVRKDGVGQFEERYWSPVNSPVFGPGATVQYIIHRVEDVTDFVKLKQSDEAHSKLADELKTHSGRMEAEIYKSAQQLQTANQRYRELNEELERRVTERTEKLRQAEEQLRQAQKMEAIGRLTGGIAHDFNNMLAVILSYTQLLLKRLPKDDPKRVYVEHIEQGGARAAELTGKLLAFSRQQVVQPKAINLNAIISGMKPLLQRLCGERTEIRTELDPTLGFVRADETQTEQVITNLVVNAHDAMREGGVLTIETKEVELGVADVRDDMIAGPYVLLSVRDTGCGMDAATQAKAFEPFFTTKERGRGTGLGLAIVHGIVKQAGGDIRVSSQVGLGTTFEIYLPRLSLEHLSEPKRPSLPSAVGGSETVLLAEDEELVRTTACTILREMGYEVLAAATGTEALQICRQEERTIHLLVTDVIMPGMNGPELALQARRIRPDMRVLYMSGYVEHALGPGPISTDAFVQKPFTPDSLLRKVREVLEARDIVHGP